MPARLRDIVRALALFGGATRRRHEDPKSGSHWKMYSASNDFYPIPANNGLKEEITDLYIRKMCRALKIDETEFRKKL